jgi:hypothetical protein
MQKATRLSSGMDSSNPPRWRGKRLRHHGDVVCHVVCDFVWSRLVVISRHMLHIYMQLVTSISRVEGPFWGMKISQTTSYRNLP